MKKYTLFVLTAFLFLFNSFKAGEDNNPFFTLLENAGLKFTRPTNTIATAVISNDELNYQYAIKDTVNKIEMRYIVIPLQELINQYNGPHPDTGSGMSRIDPNFLHTNLLIAYALKIEGKGMNSIEDVMPNINEVSHAAMDLQFHADWGAEVTIQPCDEFAQKYKYCTIFALHKDNTADAFVIFLYDNNKDNFEDFLRPDFYSLTFKKS